MTEYHSLGDWENPEYPVQYLSVNHLSGKSRWSHAPSHALSNRSGSDMNAHLHIRYTRNDELSARIWMVWKVEVVREYFLSKGRGWQAPGLKDLEELRKLRSSKRKHLLKQREGY